VHRDLKLENILLDDTLSPPKPFFIDFGLSKVFFQDQTSTDPYGTLAYCSPEIVQRRQHNGKADVWSMGVILYIMLSHRMPFLSNDNDMLTKYNILNKDINLNQRTWENISLPAKDLVAQMLSRNVKDRPCMADVINHTWFDEIRGR
jgi:serine/threonine protein kinase